MTKVDYTKLTDKQREFRREVSRLSSMANKRIRRLQESNLKYSPALEIWKDEGGVFFGVKGKTQKEVRREFHRVNNYLNSDTSSISGTKKVLKEMAENTGIKHDGYNDLIDKSKSFFELANKIEEYQKISGGYASTFSSERRWQEINKYIEDHEIDLANVDVDTIVADVAARIDEAHERELRKSYGFFGTDWKLLSK